ncbi:MAG: hypothetical protein U0905_00760 [Pirellulales bacterium]
MSGLLWQSWMISGSIGSLLAMGCLWFQPPEGADVVDEVESVVVQGLPIFEEVAVGEDAVGYLFASRNKEEAEIQRKIMEDENKVHKLLDSFRRSSKEDKENYRKQLVDIVEAQFDRKQQQQTKKVEEMQEQLRRIQDQLSRRAELRSQIVERRIAQLLGEPDELRWDMDVTDRVRGQEWLRESELLPLKGVQGLPYRVNEVHGQAPRALLQDRTIERRIPGQSPAATRSPVPSPSPTRSPAKRSEEKRSQPVDSTGTRY